MWSAKIFFFDKYDEYTHEAMHYIPGRDVDAVREFVLKNCWSESPLGIKPIRACVVFESGEAIMVVKK